MNRWGARLAVATPAFSCLVLTLVGPTRADLPASLAAVPTWLQGDAATRAAALAGLLAWALTLWLAAAVAATLASRAPGALGRAAGAVSGRIAPAVLRTTLQAGIGAGLSLTIVTTSVAGAGVAMMASPAGAATRAASGPAGQSFTWPDLGRPVGSSTGTTTEPAPVLAPPSAAATPAWPDLDRGPASGQPASEQQILPSPSAAAASVTPSTWPDLARPAGGPGAGASSIPAPATPSAVPGTQATTPAPPTRPTTPDAPTPAPLRAELTPDPDGAVVVMRGDTLWGLAAQWIRTSTGQVATDSQVAVAWPQWWQANRAVIGDDPAHLLPGQRLSPPPALLASSP